MKGELEVPVPCLKVALQLGFDAFLSQIHANQSLLSASVEVLV
jgi:hypothetical protein